VADLLQAWGEGDEAALQKLMPLVYEQLHGAARPYAGQGASLHLPLGAGTRSTILRQLSCLELTAIDSLGAPTRESVVDLLSPPIAEEQHIEEPPLPDALGSGPFPFVGVPRTHFSYLTLQTAMRKRALVAEGVGPVPN
jgi:hypothetical protein